MARRTPSVLRKTIVSFPEATAAGATTKATVARSGSSSEWVSETQNMPANMGSVLPARKVIGWVRGLEKHVAREPAPGRHINGRSLVNGHQPEDLAGQEPFQAAPKRQEHRAA